MKIAPITQPLNQTKQPLLKRVSNYFAQKRKNLRELAHDVYERVASEYRYVDIGGKRVRERDLPNWIGCPSDWEGISFEKIVLYDEDLKLMEKMTIDEKIEYRSKLIDAGRYTLEKC